MDPVTIIAACSACVIVPQIWAVAMAPTPDELTAIEPWLKEQDGNPDWPAHVLEVLDDLKRRLRHGV